MEREQELRKMALDCLGPKVYPGDNQARGVVADGLVRFLRETMTTIVEQKQKEASTSEAWN